jgi:hypothetical protein
MLLYVAFGAVRLRVVGAVVGGSRVVVAAHSNRIAVVAERPARARQGVEDVPLQGVVLRVLVLDVDERSRAPDEHRLLLEVGRLAGQSEGVARVRLLGVGVVVVTDGEAFGERLDGGHVGAVLSQRWFAVRAATVEHQVVPEVRVIGLVLPQHEHHVPDLARQQPQLASVGCW